MRIDHRRVVADKVLLRRGRAVVVNQRYVFFQNARGKFLRIRNRGRGADELRSASIKSRDALEAAQNVGQMAAQDAAVVVQFIDHHVAQVLKQALPLGVVRQDSRVQHVGIGDHQIAARANGLARVLRGVTVVGEGAHLVAKLLGPAIEFHQLVLRKGLGGEEIKCAGFRVRDQLTQDRAGYSTASFPMPWA